jgi:hypothetical protein
MTEPTWRVPDDVLTAHLEGEAVLLHMETKDYFRLNETAAVVWKALERGRDRAAIVAELVEGFDVDAAEAAEELDRLLAELAGRGLVVAAPAPAAGE